MNSMQTSQEMLTFHMAGASAFFQSRKLATQLVPHHPAKQMIDIHTYLSQYEKLISIQKMVSVYYSEWLT